MLMTETLDVRNEDFEQLLKNYVNSFLVLKLTFLSK